MNSEKLPARRRSNHPLLRVAFDDGPTKALLNALRDDLRSAYDASIPLADRRRCALAAVTTLRLLDLKESDALEFELEWLGRVSQDLGGALLLEALAEADLRAVGLETCSSAWFQTGNDLEHFAMPDLRGLHEERTTQKGAAAIRARRCWDAIIELATSHCCSGSLKLWDADECMAAVRAIVLKAVAGSERCLVDDAERRLHEFEASGIGLWNALLLQLLNVAPASQESNRHHAAQQRVLLHLTGLVAGKQLRVAGLPLGQAVGAEEPQSRGIHLLLGPIPPCHDRQEASVAKDFEALVHQRVAVAPVLGSHDLKLAFNGLECEFPWASDCIQQIASELETLRRFGVRELSLGPLLLVGPPGSGKSRLGRRLAETLRLPYVPIGCGGSHDAKVLTGTARGWASAAPSPLLYKLREHMTASAFVLLDELDKAARNGESSAPMSAALLGLLERETAARWRDGFLQVACDLSHLLFCATANNLRDIPRPLLSRFTVVYVPLPSREHLPSLVFGISADIERDWNLQPGVLPVVPRNVYAGLDLNARELRRAILRFLSRWSRETLAPERMH